MHSRLVLSLERTHRSANAFKFGRFSLPFAVQAASDPWIGTWRMDKTKSHFENFDGSPDFTLQITSSKRKTSVVLELLRGADLESTSRKHRVTAAALSEWRERFLAGGEAMLKGRENDAEDEEVKLASAGCSFGRSEATTRNGRDY